ncbi:MAG: threonine/serine dehydratase, partial [Sphingomonadales bacterium]|nr:threonine/serine dehydratase [Sphingomonadales bacterium]
VGLAAALAGAQRVGAAEDEALIAVVSGGNADPAMLARALAVAG